MISKHKTNKNITLNIANKKSNICIKDILTYNISNH